LYPAVSPTRFAPIAALLAVLMVPQGVARAQQESASVALPPPEPRPGPIEVTVKGTPRSPPWTQGRAWNSTRFWLLDPGEMEVEVWYSTRINHNGERGDVQHLWQVEYMVGVLPHVQLDVYFNYAHDKDGGFHIEGAQIEGRFSLARRYGEIWGNPALYLEWHPQTRGPNRAEVRILLGGQLLSPRLFGAINPFLEQNIDTGADGKFSADREIGASAAAGYAVVPGRLMVGGEIKAAADQQDGTTYKAAVKLGPTLFLSLADGLFHLTATGLFGVTGRSDSFNPFLVFAYHPPYKPWW
jgi:hypothetical protein